MRALPILFIFLCACAAKTQSPDTVVSMQLIDRNGFSETVSAKDRLSTYDKTDFSTPQPYQKVLRVFGRSTEGKSLSKITTYHSNGELWQYLEVESGRAHGPYREWHANGQLKLEALVIEGTPDVTETAQVTWIFDGKSKAWDEEGRLVAEISYEKGLLEGPSIHYHPNGIVSKNIPYHKDEIDGVFHAYDMDGKVIEHIVYTSGVKDGEAIGLWEEGSNSYKESYQNGLLLEASYYSKTGKLLSSIVQGNGKQALFKEGLLSSLVEYQNGLPQGEVEVFDKEGHLLSSTQFKNGKKCGKEWAFYSNNTPKLCIDWSDDSIQGIVKTWYENGILESQREMHDNKKQGLSLAWFGDGSLMFTEEYENDTLIKGAYFKKGEKKPTSKVENGKGIATLYDSEGHLWKKIGYEKGLPQPESY